MSVRAADARARGREKRPSGCSAVFVCSGCAAGCCVLCGVLLGVDGDGGDADEELVGDGVGVEG
ncbi:hypothetical protein K2F54_18415, partial [Cryobacterium sp. 1639]|uniref:hypothetical protein n=1 Tax=Cryobacterium inferilacus TaxID=2866629 RepID=UPI001C73706E